MQAYAEDLRRRVVDAVEGGMPRAASGRVFRVSLATIKRWLHRQCTTGRLAPLPRPGPRSVKRAALAAGLRPQLEAQPDATLAEHCARWERTHQMPVSTATMCRVISRHFGWTRKKD